MNVVSRRLRLGLSAATAASGFLLALVPVTAAQAAGPEQFKDTVQLPTITDTTSCAFTITINVTDRVTGRQFFDAQGERVTFHRELWPWCLWLAALLLLMDVAARRVRFI